MQCHDVPMKPDPSSPRSLWPALALGFAAGAAAVVVLALLVIAFSLSAGGALMVVIQVAFGRSGALAALLLYGAVLLALVLAAVVLRAVVGRIAPVMRSQFGAGRGPVPLMAQVLGMAAGLVLTAWALPTPITSSARQFLTGQTAAERAARPAVEARSRRLEAVLAGHPDGPEALLLKAVNRVAKPLPAGGGQLSNADLQARADALRALAPALPPHWQAVALGTAAEQLRGRSGVDTTDASVGQALVEAGRVGSRAFRVLGAQELERIAARREAKGPSRQADEAWQQALDSYAAAGADYEVARLYDEALPERLRTLPLPPRAPAPTADAALAQRLWTFAQALGDDAAWDIARPGERDLALATTLVALELAPEASPLATVNPAQRWTLAPSAISRWLLSLRHARGDCLAALALADATRQRLRDVGVGRSQPGGSSLDLAWATVLAESAQACVRTEEERVRVREYRAQLDYLNFEPGVLDAARAGLAAGVQGLR
jgi:hypothetical protein